MWNRSESERGRESAEATGRRVLLIQMLVALKDAGDTEAFESGDGSEMLYTTLFGTNSKLVAAPDQGAVQVFDRLRVVTESEHRELIFALVRQFDCS